MRQLQTYTSADLKWVNEEIMNQRHDEDLVFQLDGFGQAFRAAHWSSVGEKYKPVHSGQTLASLRVQTALHPGRNRGP